MNSEILRIIEGGLSNDKRKIVSYSTRLAERLTKEGETALAKCILDKINNSQSQNAAVADAMRCIPLDSDSRLQIVEVIPPEQFIQKIILDSIIEEQVDEFISTISHNNQLEMAGIRIPKTMLLYGAPGCGKTSIAHYISQQTGLPLIVARLDGIVSSLLGSTAKNIRKIFEYAQSIPCILFLDEFDAIAKARDDSHELGELKRVINSLLQNIDSLPSDSVLIAATNHPEMLDQAVWRRFVQKIEVGIPNNDEIREMAKVFAEPFETDFFGDEQRFNCIINAFAGFSPSDIKIIFDRVKVKTVINGGKTLMYDQLLTCIFQTNSSDKSEKSLVLYLSENGMTQTAINKTTGMSLRKIKTYLSNKHPE